MSEMAAHLVDEVIPPVPMRQWVLTVPQPLRSRLAYDRALCDAVLRVFLQAVFGWLRRQAKQELGLLSTSQAHPGAVTVIQRFNSAAALSVHFHSVVTDGVFVQQSPGAPPEFRALPAPSAAEVAQVSWDTCQRTLAVLRRRGPIQGTLVLGPKAGSRVVRLRAQAAGRLRVCTGYATPVCLRPTPSSGPRWCRGQPRLRRRRVVTRREGRRGPPPVRTAWVGRS